jgi:hypothetical protein
MEEMEVFVIKLIYYKDLNVKRAEMGETEGMHMWVPNRENV